MKKIAFTILTTLTLISSLSQADCREGYRHYLQSLYAQKAASKSAAINGFATTAVVAGALAATGGMAAPLMIMSGSGPLVSLTRLELVKRKYRNYLRALILLDEAYDGHWVQTSKMLRKLSKAHLTFSVEQWKSWVRINNENNAFCPTDEITGQTKFLGAKQIFKAARLSVM